MGKVEGELSNLVRSRELPNGETRVHPFPSVLLRSFIQKEAERIEYYVRSHTSDRLVRIIFTSIRDC